MTRTGYAWGMSNTPPSDPNHINTKALEGLVHAFDRAVMGKYGIPVELPKLDSKLQKFEQQVISTLLVGQRTQHKPAQFLSFWQIFRPLNAIRRFRDNIRLRKYNREWIKNNTH